MIITVEISLYPLVENYTEHIITFIKALRSHTSITVKTTAMSTYIVGEYSTVMKVLTKELQELYKHVPDSATVMKIIPKDLNVDGGFLEF